MSAAKGYAKFVKGLDPKVFAELHNKFANGNHQVNVGIREDKGAVTHKDSDLTVAQIGAIHEFGAPAAGIPERPFLRGSIQKNRQKYIALNRNSLKKIISGDLDMNGALGLLGTRAAADVQREIRAGDFVALDPKTIKRKGSSKPLIDTGQLRQSIDWELDK